MSDVFTARNNGESYVLKSPTAMPQASSFLWNSKMMIQVNCRGYVTSQFMQPEPAKYSRGPNIEAQTFMQPEQNYYAHHPGRFIYIKDNETGDVFSAPYEPMRSKADDFEFIADKHKISWVIRRNQIEVIMSLTLSTDLVAEFWTFNVKNLSTRKRSISVYPYFSVGYMSWMNQSASYNKTLNAIVCKSITPYQKYPDYFKNLKLKDITYLLAQKEPASWESIQSDFEGEGGLHNPSAIDEKSLGRGCADYETPVAVMHYDLTLLADENKTLSFIFGAAQSIEDITEIRDKYFPKEVSKVECVNSKKNNKINDEIDNANKEYKAYVGQAAGILNIETPDEEFNHYVNHWLPRQVFYHGDVNRLSTDPQTRNYLQDAMGMSYLAPEKTRLALITALSQQDSSGEMPDGILLSDQAELKYINQVPHADHCVWLPICLETYLNETNDFALLDVCIGFKDNDEAVSLYEHICRAMDWLVTKRDSRGLSYIQQGDWCDPMNMVGYKGRGVSGWLTLASAYALNTWSGICGQLKNNDDAQKYTTAAKECNKAVNKHLWDGEWYARGMTDDGRIFGIKDDNEGKIFLNPQSWAMLSGALDKAKEKDVLGAINTHLNTPFGTAMLAPAFTHMVEDIGRVTQKFPGSAENGSVYNHASAFYAYALYEREHGNLAFETLRKMLPAKSSEDCLIRGQLPVFIPNYYRGAYKQLPRTAGRSSQLFNTGTVHWFYRCLIDGMFGVRGAKDGLIINPKLPVDWTSIKFTRIFRGATFYVDVIRKKDVSEKTIRVNNALLNGSCIQNIQEGEKYEVHVELPVKSLVT